MLEEIVRHAPDVVCLQVRKIRQKHSVSQAQQFLFHLQEVDHFQFLQRSLSALGYRGLFLPKPDSPCLYLEDNSGPDGCAIFYNADRSEQLLL